MHMGSRVTEFSQPWTARGRPARIWPRAVVFDCDGLLVDTAHCWHAAYRAIADSVGHTLDRIDLSRLDGASVTTARDYLANALGHPIANADLRHTLQHTITTEPLRAMPGAEHLLRTLAVDELPVAVATNGPQTTVHTALTRAGLKHFLPVIVSAEETGVFKPAPDVYLRACGRLAVDPSDAIAFEDSAIGAQAARSAGLTVIIVPSSPAARRYADLTVPKLTDPRVYELLGLSEARNGFQAQKPRSAHGVTSRSRPGRS